MVSCPFCTPAAERIFHEDALVRGLWDAFPVAPGHALLVPRRHVADWFDATEAERAALLSSLDVARAAILARYEVEGAFGLERLAAPARRSARSASSRSRASSARSSASVGRYIW